MSVSPGLRLVGFRLAAVGVSTLSLMLVARTLGPQGYGPYAAAAALFSLPLAAGILGGDQLFLSGRIDAAAVRFLAARVSTVTGSVGVAIAVLHPSLTTEARTALVLLSLSGVAELSRLPWLLEPQREESFSVRGRRELTARVAVASATVAAALVGFGAVGLAAAAMLANLSITVSWLLTRRSAPPTAPSATLWRSVRAGTPFTASSLFYTGYVSMPLLVVASVSTASETAYFRTAALVLVVGYVLPAALNGEALRSLLYNLRGGRRTERVPVRHFVMANTALGLAAALGTWLVLGDLLELILGEAYRGVGALATVLAVSLPLNFVNSVMDNVMIAGGYIRRVLLVQGTTLVFALVVVPTTAIQYGTIGACWSLTACEAFATVCYALLHAYNRRNPGAGLDASTPLTA